LKEKCNPSILTYFIGGAEIRVQCFICITNTITKCWGALIYLLEFFFVNYYSCLKCFILMLTVVSIGTHSGTSPTRGFSAFCFLFPDALITWMTLKHKQASRCAHNLVALLVEGNT